MGSRSKRKMRRDLAQKQEMRDYLYQRASVATGNNEMEIKMPDDDKVVLKKVPAKIGEEVVGEAVLFEDGSSTVILNDDISDEARAKLNDVVVAFNAEHGAAFTIEEVLGKGL